MAVYTSPVGVATAAAANTLDVLVTLKENLCHRFNVNATNQPTATTTYTAGTPVLNGTTVFVPITAQVTITTPSGKCGCNPNVQVFTERFEAAFIGQTALPTAVTITNNGTIRTPYNVNTCGVASGYAISDSLTIALTTA